MELKLERSNILQVDFISKKNTLKLLPVGKKGKQKLIIGDDSGQVICYEFKKGEPQVVFQFQAFEGPISSIAIAGIGPKLDRIFISHGQKILGITKKGKEFFKLQTPLIEEINNIAVYETKIYTGCEYIYNLYDDGHEAAFFINKDVINDIFIEKITRDSDFDVILACQDNRLRIIQGSQCVYEIPTNAAATSVMSVRTADNTKRMPLFVVYGMESGAFGEFRLDMKADNSLSHTHLWTVEDLKRSPISCMKSCDLTKSGVAEIIVGHDDGRVEVFSRDESGIQPKLVFSYDIEESIRGLECGLVNSTEFFEIIVAGYSGKLISFTTEPVKQRAHDDNYGRSIQTINNENRIRYLHKEIDALKAKIEKEREKTKKLPVSTSLKPPPEFSVNAKFLLDVNLAAYALSIEIQSPIDMIILRSPVDLDFLDTGTSLVSVTPPELLREATEDSAYKFVAAFRGQTTDTKRMMISIRSTEGESGDVLVTVVTALNATTKAAKVLPFSLKPLSLHSKVHILTSEQLARPRNVIKFTGNIIMATIHEWVQSLLPDIIPRLPEDAVHETYYYKHTFTDSITIVEYRKNELIFESESASTIVIVKENIVRLANTRRVQIESSLKSSSSSIRSFLSLIRPKLEYQISLARKVDLVEAIQEVSMQTDATGNGNNVATAWLSPEYAEILAQQETIRQEFKARAKSLEYLSGVITDLYIDWNRLHNRDVRNSIPSLHQVILTNDFEQLVDFFSSNDEPRTSRK